LRAGDQIRAWLRPRLGRGPFDTEAASRLHFSTRYFSGEHLQFACAPKLLTNHIAIPSSEWRPSPSVIRY
jgi:hypothetical protein